jgi:glucosamine-6-phosphate deaminase
MKCFEIDLSRLLRVTLLDKQDFVPPYKHCTRTTEEYILYVVESGRLLMHSGGEDLEAECQRYEDKIASLGGIDLFLGGSGVDGHIAFNEPFTSLTSRTGVRALTEDTLIVNSRFFGNDPTKVPKTALSVGVGTVCDSKQVLLVISGHNKARALRHCVEGGVDHAWTISALQLHKDGIIACDEAACGELKVDTYKYFKEIYKNEK